MITRKNYTFFCQKTAYIYFVFGISDNLELLERGELKDLTAFGSEEADEDVEEVSTFLT